MEEAFVFLVFSGSMDLNDVGNLHLHLLRKQKEAMAYPNFTRMGKNGQWARTGSNGRLFLSSPVFSQLSGISYEGQVEEVPERIEFAILKDHLLRDLEIYQLATEICSTKAVMNETCRHQTDR